jgi:hypothetical protein
MKSKQRERSCRRQTNPIQFITEFNRWRMSHEIYIIYLENCVMSEELSLPPFAHNEFIEHLFKTFRCV